MTVAGRVGVLARRAEDRARLARAVEGCGLGYQPVEAASLAVARALCADAAIDCLLLHRDPPDAGVFEVLAALPRVDGHTTVPVIVMSGHLEPATCRRFVRAGATDAVGDDVLAAGGLGVAVENARERRAQQRDATLLRHGEDERARLAVAGIEDGLWDWDVCANRVHWSDRCFEMLGYSPGEFEPSFGSFIELVHPDDRARVEAQNLHHNEHCTPLFESEFRLRMRDGRYRWIHSRARAIYDADGRMTRVVGFHVDVDDRKRVELALERRTASLELLNEAAGALIAAREPDAVIAELFEKVAEFVGADAYFHYRVEARPGARPALRLAMASGIDAEARAAFARLEFGQAVCGRVAECRRVNYCPDLQTAEDAGAAGLKALGIGVYQCHPLEAGGQLLGTLGFGSRRKTAYEAEERTLLEAVSRHIAAVLARANHEASLRASEGRYRGLAEAVPMPVWATDAEGRAVDFNSRWSEYTGLDRESSLACGWRRALHPDDEPFVDAQWSAAVTAGGRLEVEHRLRRADGEYRWVLSQAVPVRDDDGRVQRWFGASTDVHDQRRVAEEREQLLLAERAARTEADRAGRLKDEFLATISHELRTPLNSILGWVRLLGRKNLQPAMYEEGVRVIERNAKVQAQLISDLLDVNRIVSGKLLLELDRVVLNDVVAAALESLQPQAAERQLQVHASLAPDLPPVRGDFARLQQAASNLLSNAVKFTAPGGRIEVATRAIDGWVVTEVRDTGQGIAPEFLPHVFDRFTQADGSTTRRHGGLGLGLAIVKQLVEMHGGRVEAESEGAGRGATFRLRVPAAGAMDVADVPRAGVEAPVDPESLRGLAVLVVDDQADAVEFMRRLLVEHGAEVTTATRAEEALEILRGPPERRPELLVSDIGMPGMDGYELLRAVRCDLGLGPERLPAIAVTAFARDDDRRQVEAAGYQVHLPKPLQPDRLIAALGRLSGRGATSVGSSGAKSYTPRP